jgi:hypothetical protein
VKPDSPNGRRSPVQEANMKEVTDPEEVLDDSYDQQERIEDGDATDAEETADTSDAREPQFD